MPSYPRKAADGESAELLDLSRIDQAIDGLVAGDAGGSEIAKTTARPAQRSATTLRSAEAMPRGIAVAASPTCCE